MHRLTRALPVLLISLFAIPAFAQHREEAPPPPPPPRQGVPAPPPPQGGAPFAAFAPPPGHKETAAEIHAREEHERQLQAQDAEREKTREERQRQARDAEAARIRSIPPSPELTAELQRYAQHKADLERIKQVAQVQGRADAMKRCDDLLAKEEARHTAWLAAHQH